MKRNHDLADVDLRFKFFPKSGKSAAFSNDEEKPLIFLPLGEIEMEPTRPKPGQVVVVTMPQWLAEDKNLV